MRRMYATWVSHRLDVPRYAYNSKPVQVLYGPVFLRNQELALRSIRYAGAIW
jgi:hypothetical protein